MGACCCAKDGRPNRSIGNALSWLRRENAYGAHIYIRPSGAHAPSLIDDLSADSLKRMKEAGFETAVTVETSPGNFQTWLNHGRVLTCALSTLAAKDLAGRFGGDPSSADWRHFGRLAGFTNQKPGRRLPTGLPPFVQLRQSRGGVYTAAPEFIEQVIALAERSRLRTAASASAANSFARAITPSSFRLSPRSSLRRRSPSRRYGVGDICGKPRCSRAAD